MLYRIKSRRQTFQSTPPVKAATDYFWFNNSCNLISIHAAREGGDVGLNGCN